MDNNPIAPTVQEAASQQKFRIPTFINPKENTKGFIASIFILFAILGISAYSATIGNEAPDKPKEEKPFAVFTPLSKNTLVYGYWKDKNSYIEAADLNSGKIYSLAKLDTSIKKVTITSPTSALFINKTDTGDHGKEISSVKFRSKVISSLITADKDYGIDDYVMSPNKKFIATWEIYTPENSVNLTGGRSRVYAIELSNPQNKNLIYDEPISGGSFVHYPLTITNAGEVYMDLFEANTPAGWAHGMSASSFTGTDKKDIAEMSEGTFSTQPVPSSDGRYLVFSGYDGVKGVGTETIELRDDFRQAILNPNTVEVYDLFTKKRRKILGNGGTNFFPMVTWDKESNSIFYLGLLSNKELSGFYILNPANGSNRKLDLGSSGSIISALGKDQLLIGTQDTSLSTVGNLGAKYTQIVKDINIFDINTKDKKAVNLGIPLMQYIDTFQSAYFSDLLVTGNLAEQANVASSENINKLQLKTFALKPELGSKRIEQQSKPKCGDISSQVCNSMLGTNLTVDGQGFTNPHNPVFEACVHVQWRAGYLEKTCLDSPLYLYGQAGVPVSVRIGTSIYESNIPNKAGNYSGYLTGDGGLKVENKTYPNISFNYTPALRRLPDLDYGRIVKADRINEAIKDYGNKLGLNSIEIDDLITSLSKFSLPYVLVSFYDDEISKKILPISFFPEPDVYRNIVFYLRPVEVPFDIKEPEFEKNPVRTGFTAVEVSYIIDK